MGKLFGTDGIRGIAGEELTAELAFRLGLAVAKVLNESSQKKTSVIIGKDTRLSGDMFEAAITAGLCAMGSDVYLVGVVPTPAVAYLVREIKADAGIDIGFTLIGMHLKKVAVPVRLENNKIGAATIVAARTRPKFIGGIRAIYDEELN